MLFSPTIHVAMPTASIAGASSDRLPVISPTISMTASGACAMPPNSNHVRDLLEASRQVDATALASDIH
jgi:hypothetical protein